MGCGKDKHEGYQYGLLPGLELLHLARLSGVGEVSYYGFTTDNCKRPAQQLAAFSQACVDAIEMIAVEPVSLLVVGNTNSPLFPETLRQYTTRKDLNGGGIKVNFLVNYGWEWDLSSVSGAGTNRKAITDGLGSREVSRIDLVMRWGGMRRLSGFLPVQTVYSDFFITDRLWPDFVPQDFQDALNWYQTQDVTLGG